MKIEVNQVFGRLAGEHIGNDGQWRSMSNAWLLIAHSDPGQEVAVEGGQQSLCNQMGGAIDRADRRNLHFEIKVESAPAKVRHTADGIDLAPAIDAGLHFIEHGLVCGHYLPETPDLPPELQRLLRDIGGALGADVEVTVVDLGAITPRPGSAAN